MPARLNWLDRTIGAVAPSWGLERARARHQIGVVTAKNEFDGATQGRRAASWKRRNTDGNAELNPMAQLALRAVAHELVRNNAHAARAVGAIAENMVGAGISYRVMRNGKLDQNLTDLARRHFDTTACDAEGRHNLYGLQLQAARSIPTSGAVLVRRRWRRMNDGLPVPMQLQLLEPDYINMQLTGPLSNGGYRIAGIEFDPIGRRTGYQMYSGHPGSVLPGKLDTNFIAASEIAHAFRVDRPEQQHGATWFAPIIVRTKDYGEYTDAQLVRQKMAACYSVFKIADGESTDPVPTTDSNGGAIDVAPNTEYLEPGIIVDVAPGTSIEFADPPGVEGFGDVARISLQEIATGLGIPYESMTGDLSQVSFISGRLGRLQFKRSIETWQWTMFIPQVCEPAGRWFLEAAALAGYDVTGASFSWTTPPFEMMDPASEVPAKVAEIRAGLTSLPEAQRERGYDPDALMDEIETSNADIDHRKLTLDCDPRRVTQVGNAVVPNADIRNPPPPKGA